MDRDWKPTSWACASRLAIEVQLSSGTAGVLAPSCPSAAALSLSCFLSSETRVLASSPLNHNLEFFSVKGAAMPSLFLPRHVLAWASGLNTHPGRRAGAGAQNATPLLLPVLRSKGVLPPNPALKRGWACRGGCWTGSGHDQCVRDLTDRAILGMDQISANSMHKVQPQNTFLHL